MGVFGWGFCWVFIFWFFCLFGGVFFGVLLMVVFWGFFSFSFCALKGLEKLDPVNIASKFYSLPRLKLFNRLDFGNAAQIT